MAADRGGPLVDAFEDAGRDPDKTVATTDGWVSEFEFEIGTRSAMDREESKKTSDRMLAVRAREAREGVPRIAGRRAYGWNYDMTEHVPEEVARIHEAAERVLASESVWSICDDGNTQGVPTVTGRPWTITSILTSGRIAGLREHKGVLVAMGQWEPIVTEEQHQALVVALAPKRAKPRKGRTYPLTSLMRCGLCGGRMRSLQREGGRRTYVPEGTRSRRLRPSQHPRPRAGAVRARPDLRDARRPRHPSGDGPPRHGRRG